MVMVLLGETWYLPGLGMECVNKYLDVTKPILWRIDLLVHDYSPQQMKKNTKLSMPICMYF